MSGKREMRFVVAVYGVGYWRCSTRGAAERSLARELSRLRRLHGGGDPDSRIREYATAAAAQAAIDAA